MRSVLLMWNHYQKMSLGMQKQQIKHALCIVVVVPLPKQRLYLRKNKQNMFVKLDVVVPLRKNASEPMTLPFFLPLLVLLCQISMWDTSVCAPV